MIGFSSYSQKKESNDHTLIREESNSWISYKNKNWDIKYSPDINDLGYDFIAGSDKDTLKIYPIVRQVISSKYHDQLNGKRWVINTKCTGYGQIVSISFLFLSKDDSGIDIDEFAILAERIKKEVQWELTFNKKVTDLFYMQWSFPGPKFQ